MDLGGNIIEGEPLAVMLVQEAEDRPGFIALIEARRNKGGFAAPQQQMPHSQKPAVCLQLIAETAVLQNAEQLADLREQKLLLAVGGKSDHLHLRILDIGQEVFLFDDASVKEREQGRLHVEREVTRGLRRSRTRHVLNVGVDENAVPRAQGIIAALKRHYHFTLEHDAELQLLVPVPGVEAKRLIFQAGFVDNERERVRHCKIGFLVIIDKKHGVFLSFAAI